MLQYDYAFIEEVYTTKGKKTTVIERYFMESDTIPTETYKDDVFQDIRHQYLDTSRFYYLHYIYPYSLNPLLQACSASLPVQELRYRYFQVMQTGCVVDDGAERKFRRHTSRELRSIYSILSMIDRKNNKVTVSVQYPPRKPVFSVLPYNAVWDF
jgi:hypothetical protein